MFVIEINSTNNALDFSDDSGSYNLNIPPGSYTPAQLATALALAMTLAGFNVYLVSYDVFSGKFTFQLDEFGSTFNLLFLNGTGSPNTIGYVLGFEEDSGILPDYTNDSSYTSLQSVNPTQELSEYYSNLLLAQFKAKESNLEAVEVLVSGILIDGLPTQVLNGYNLNATVQTLKFSDTPNRGSFTLAYAGVTSSAIAANATEDQILSALNGLLGYRAATPSGIPFGRSVEIAFSYPAAPLPITIASNTLVNASLAPITITVVPNTAIGQQLDWIGKYVGVTRSGLGSNGQAITLSDNDFILLIQIAIASNHFGSSLATIQQFIADFFPGVLYVFDYANVSPMRMGYYVNTSTLSNDLLQLVIAESLLPVPMAVEFSVAGAPVINMFYGFIEYTSDASTVGLTPFNCNTSYSLADYNTDWIWLDYSNSL